MPLLIKHLISRHLSSALFFILAIASTTPAFASYIDSKTDGKVVYSLFSAPNKILRYDMVAEANLTTINLDKTPSAFIVEDGIAYIAFQRELRAINLTSGTSQFIRNTSTDIIQILTLGENLIIIEQNTITTLSTLDFHVVESKNQFFSGAPYLASNIQSSIYIRSSPFNTHKIILASDGTEKSDTDISHFGNGIGANMLFINASQNKIYDNAGFIYFADTLTTAGNLNGGFNTITFIGDNPIVTRDNKLTIFTAVGVELGEIFLPSQPIFSATYAQKIFTFSLTGTDFSTAISDLSNFKLPAIGQAVNPAGFVFTPDFYEQDEQGTIYLIDRESLSVFRWSTTQNSFLETWPLQAPPTSATYSTAHQRLYLGYGDGKITWLSPAEATPQEHNFLTLAQAVHYLVAAENYLFAVAGSGGLSSEYSIDKNGSIINFDSQYTNLHYLWNPVSDRIYRYRHASSNSLGWAELNQITGVLSATNTPTENNFNLTSAPLSVSNDGQYILNTSGQLIDALDLNIANSLSTSISDGVWINGKPITINKASLSLDFWSKTFEQLSSYPLSRAIHARLLAVDKKLLLIQVQSSGLNFSLFDPEQLPDADSDTINDLVDNCPNSLNTDQADIDSDGEGNACDKDDDNDGIPDTTELSVNLNPLDSNDAKNDVDKDGFSNGIEHLLGSLLDDSSSVPDALFNFYKSFEHDWPAGFYNSPNSIPWTTQSDKSSAIYGLGSAALIDPNSNSEVNFTAPFKAGIFSIKFKFKTKNYNHSPYLLSILVDGISINSQIGSSYDGALQTLNATVTQGTHTISLRVTNYFMSESQDAQFVVEEVIFQSNPDNDDMDGDGLGSQYDNCPKITNPNQSDVDKDAEGDACDPLDNRPKDADLDGIPDNNDNCQLLENPNQADMDFDFIGDACDLLDNRPKDTDLDNTYDDYDNCPTTVNLNQSDVDYDGIGDVCDPSDDRPKDTDNDGHYDSYDNCPANYNSSQFDVDNDSIGDACDPSDDRPKDSDGDVSNDGVDNCITTFNPSQFDRDHNGIADSCQDTDLDGAFDNYDNCQKITNPLQSDLDADGAGDACDAKDDRPTDIDFDYVYGSYDNCPTIKNPQQLNMDDDNLGDACDDDIDGDGIANAIEKTFAFMNERDAGDAEKDQDNDGVSNGYEITHATKPEVANIFPKIHLLNYYPLGEINFTINYFSFENFAFTEKMTKLTTKNNYLLSIPEFKYVNQIELRENGIYSVSEQDATTKITYSNSLILPAAMSLGSTVTSEGTATIVDENGNTSIDKITTSYKLVAEGQKQWKGITYPSITIVKTVITNEEDVSSDETTYLKGIGPAFNEEYYLDKMEIISLDKPAAAEPMSLKGGGKSGGGAVDIWFYLIIALFSSICSRRYYFPRQAPTIINPLQ